MPNVKFKCLVLNGNVVRQGLRIKRNNVLETLKSSIGKRVVEALVKLWREKGHLGIGTS